MPQRREGSRCARARAEDRNRCQEKGLCSLGVLLEVWIRNDASTFDTSDLAGFVFLFRDGVGDQAAVRTGVRWPLWGRLQGSSCLLRIHHAPPGMQNRMVTIVSAFLPSTMCRTTLRMWSETARCRVIAVKLIATQGLRDMMWDLLLSAQGKLFYTAHM